MERNASFSIYPNKWVRIVVHVLFWLCLFVVSSSLNITLFNTEIYALPNLYYSVIVTLISAIIYYLSCKALSKKLETRQYLSFLFQLFFIYIFAVCSALFSLNLIAGHFPDYPRLQAQSNRYALKNMLDVFSYDAFLWTFTVTATPMGAAFFIKLIKNYYESSKDKLKLIEQKNQMELNFLRSQIQPHFLFNTLNNIYGLVVENEKASQSILQLSDLLRFSLYKSGKGDISLKEEIKFLSDYINLEKMRHRDSKVEITYDFGEVADEARKIKPLLLVNFIENAFKHGVNATKDRSWVRIILKEQEEALTFKVANNKPLHKQAADGKGRQGLGLANVRRRLELEYPDRYSLNINETEEVYEVELVLKLKKT